MPSTGPTSSAVRMGESKAGELGRDGAFTQMHTRGRLYYDGNGQLELWDLREKQGSLV